MDWILKFGTGLGGMFAVTREYEAAGNVIIVAILNGK
jgi:hypothetical protein